MRAGTTTKSDELRARLELTSGQQQLVAALDTLQTTAYSLGRLVGANGPVGAKRSADEEPRALALNDSEIVRLAIRVVAVGARGDTRRKRRRGRSRVRRARPYVPGLRVTGGYNWANQTPARRRGASGLVGRARIELSAVQRLSARRRGDARRCVGRSRARDRARRDAADARRSGAAARRASLRRAEHLARAGGGAVGAGRSARAERAVSGGHLDGARSAHVASSR